MAQHKTIPSPLQESQHLSGAGVGFKPIHVHDILDDEQSVDWFEVHAENYMGAGGRPHFWLEKIRERYPLSVHGVGLSIGGSDDLDTEHLKRLKTVVDRYEPELVSEHLAWSTHQGQYYNDLLALPYNKQTLENVINHIDQTQNYLGREILIENPSTYIAFENSDMEETTFISEILESTGCKFLLDVNNVYVSCTNHDLDTYQYINNLPLDQVCEIHLAGHAVDPAPSEKILLIDAHGSPVADPVWELYESVLKKIGPVPTLIEWDNDVPAWDILKSEAELASSKMEIVEKGAQDVA